MTTRCDIDDVLSPQPAAACLGRNVRLVRAVAVLVTAACGHADPTWPQLSQPAELQSGQLYIPVGSYPGTVDMPVVASAPAWIGDERGLGLLFDDSFRPLSSSPIKVAIGGYANTDVENACVEFGSAQAFRATVSIEAGFDIGPLSAGVGFSESDYASQYRRFLHCRFFQHHRTVEIQPDVDLSMIRPDAQYILTKMQFGCGKEVIAENMGSMTQRDFERSAEVGFAYFRIGASDGASMSVSNSSVHLYERKRGGGVQCDMAGADMSRPVLVEYRRLCGPRGCISPGRYRISDFPLKFSPLDLHGKPWDKNGSGLDLVLSLDVDGEPVGEKCIHNDITQNQYDCASDLKNVIIELKNKSSKIEFHAIDDDDDGPYILGHDYDDVGGGVADSVVGNRPGVPLAFRTYDAVESASITLEPL